MTDHPITPPPELLKQWAHSLADWNTVVPLIAQWGADQELKRVLAFIAADPMLGEHVKDYLHKAMRPTEEPHS